MRPIPIALLALVLPATALAIDLPNLVEAWTITTDGPGGNDGIDVSTDVEINAFGDVIAVGYVDGEAGHQSDAYAVSYATDGTTLWTLTQDVGATGASQLSSDDRFWSVALEPSTNLIAWCGRQGGTGVENDPLSYFYVEVTEPNAKGAAFPPVTDWVTQYVDGNGATSRNQDCFSLDWLNGSIYTAGWGEHGDDEGRWLSFTYEEASGLSSPPLTYDYTAFAAVPDQARAIAVNAATTEVSLAGVRGVTGAEGGLLNNTEGFVRHYDYTGQLSWEDAQGSKRNLDDGFLDVTTDAPTQAVIAAGYMNNGLDNLGGSDLDWWVVSYDSSDGTPAWGATYDGGGDDVATSVEVDASGNVVVGGWTTDAKTGNKVWRVAVLSSYDGGEIDSWVGPSYAGDAVLNSIALRSGLLAMTGSVDDGAGPSFATTLLDQDTDGDGTADAVDACPMDPLKAEDAGDCGCNVPDADTDGDGVLNCLDNCPDDANKAEPGECGCGEPDIDSDGDDVLDCNDGCEDNPDKTAPGICGCDTPDSDSDNDGVLGCNDACSDTPPNADVDEFGCTAMDETGTDGDGGGSDGGNEGCGCSTSTPGPSVALIAGLLLTIRRRRWYEIGRAC